eukprot:COSAG06_NODE_701_length_12943_cov_458.708891_6_plen_63_part_00
MLPLGIINPERDGGESEDAVSKERPDAYPAERWRGGEIDTARGAGEPTHKLQSRSVGCAQRR